jgi:catechol 2,3-dioxygenase-like lactoylglutathione lyase family enzyme
VSDGDIVLLEVIPIIRMFDVNKALEFYCDLLGFHPLGLT